MPEDLPADNQDKEAITDQEAAVAVAYQHPVAIQAEGLSKRYPRRNDNALTDFNLPVLSGQIFGLIGANGAGKTTFLKICATIIQPTAGDVLVEGYSVRRYPNEVRRLIGYMPDDFGLYEDMQVGEYLEFFAACYGLRGKKRTRLINELLQLVDLAGKRNEPLRGLSRGMKQRLCLAHALVHDPKVLLLDEPASGIDPRARFELRELLRELSRMGKTIVVSSHVLSELEYMCDSIAIMQRGKLVACGTTEDIAHSFGGAAQRTVNVRVLTRLDLVRAENAANEFMQTVKDTVVVDESGRRLEVDILGDEASCADFLAFLTNAGVHVAHFSQKAIRLEEYFLREDSI
jgi:ABC-2 type transport system ATP-binding protein